MRKFPGPSKDGFFVGNPVSMRRRPIGAQIREFALHSMIKDKIEEFARCV